MTAITTYPILLESNLVVLNGCGFGIDQSTILGSLRLNLPYGVDTRQLADSMARILDVDPGDRPVNDRDAKYAIACLLLDCHVALQQQAKIPVFSPSVIVDINTTGITSQSGRLNFAAPSTGRKPSQVALGHVVKIANSLVQKSVDSASTDYGKLSVYAEQARVSLREFSLRGVNSMNFLKAAYELGMATTSMLDRQSPLLAIGLGHKCRWLSSSHTDRTSTIGTKVARDKLVTAAVLQNFGLPVPQHYPAANEQQASSIAEELGYPVVVKPSDCEQGRGVYANLQNQDQVRAAFRNSSAFSANILVEKHVDGEDYRLTVMQDRVIKVMHRLPGGVTGDGKHSVRELYDLFQHSEENQEIIRREGKSRLLWDEEAEELLSTQHLTGDSVPEENQFVFLRRKNNISTGGSYQVIPVESVHRDNIDLAVRAASVLQLDIAGIDLLTRDIAMPWHECDAVVCEVNSQPQIGVRHTPSIYRDILHELVPAKGRIPLHLHIVTGEAEQLRSTDEDNRKSVIKLAEKTGCDAITTAEGGWIKDKRCLWHPTNSYGAARNLLLDPDVHSLLCVLRSRDVLRYGLPAHRFDSVHLIVAQKDNKPETDSNKLPLLRAMVAPHTESFIETSWLELERQNQQEPD